MKLLNFGSCNLDFVYTVPHIVRAGETLAAERRACFAGGKGLNQSIALARAGAKVCHAGCIGQDGEPLRDLLSRAGADTKHLRTLDLPTGHAVIQVEDSGENSILLFGGANAAVTPTFADEVLADFEKGDWLLLQNEISHLSYIIDRAHEKGMCVILNPSPIGENLKKIDLAKLDWLILNEVEGEAFTGEKQPAEMLTYFRTHCPHTRIVLTLGKRGAIYADEATTVQQRIFKVTALDTTAAGDTFTGYFFAALAGGKAPKEALRLGAAASAIAVTRAGASPSIPTCAEVTEALKTLREEE